METKAKFMTLLAMSMCLILAHQGANADANANATANANVTANANANANATANVNVDAEEEMKGKKLIDLVCKERANRDLCEKVLLSDPSSSTADLKGLVMISLKEASATAKSILVDAKKMIDDPLIHPAYQQGLSDCKQNLLDAQSQIEDTIASVLSNDKLDAQVWLKAALAAIDTCDDSIPGDDDILSRRSVEFRQLCNIAVAINKAMMGFKSSPKGRKGL